MCASRGKTEKNARAVWANRTSAQTAPSVSPPVGEVSTQLTEGLTERTQGRAAFMGGRGKPLPYARTTGYRSSRGITKESETEKNVGAELAPPAYIDHALLLLLLKNNL